MQLGKKGIIAIVCAVVALAPQTKAAHATNFLASLYDEVTNRVANPGTNAAPKVAALKAAARTLAHNTKDFSADVSALATASTILNKRFPNDATLLGLEGEATANYAAEAHLERYALLSVIGTNTLRRGASNQLAQLDGWLATANNESNSIPVRDRALAKAFNRLKTLGTQVRHAYAWEAPAAVTGTDIALVEAAPNNSERTLFLFHTRGEGGIEYYNYETHGPEGEELGVWTYEKTSKNTALLHCQPNYPNGFTTAHDMSLTFNSPNTGTFSGQTWVGEHVTGSFSITH